MLVYLQPCGMSPVCERADISTAPEHSVEMETPFQGWLELIPAKSCNENPSKRPRFGCQT